MSVGLGNVAGKGLRHPIGDECRLPSPLHAMDIPERHQGLGNSGIVLARHGVSDRGHELRSRGIELGKLATRIAGAAIVIHVG